MSQQPKCDESRRGFLRNAAAIGGAALTTPVGAFASAGRVPGNVQSYLADHVVPREAIDRFLDPDARVWATYHPTYGYLLRNAFLRDGVDGSRTIGRYTPGGPRRQVNFPDQACRLHTYGDSFTQGHQVSDGETWQEVLAAHFCEPIRNYGIGGFGVYQAYRRMLDIESTDEGVDNLILNIWGDDHHRSVYSCRWLSFPNDFLPAISGVMFHANPWVHARIDPQTGGLQELPNACPTPESLYNLCDAEWMIDQFAGDDVTHALVAMNTGEVEETEPLERLAEQSGYGELDLSTSDATRLTGRRLMNRYSVEVGKLVVDAAHEFSISRNKRLFVLLSHPSGSVWRHCEGKTAEQAGAIDWHPADFQQHLTASGIPYVDTVQPHIEDFKRFRGSAQEYVDRYYIGHYNPTGNHFYAFGVKDALVDWLDPKPPAYASVGDETLIRFEGYLPE